MKKKILITGAGGFLGIDLLKEGLMHESYELWAVSSNAEKIKKLVNSEKINIVSREWPLSQDFLEHDFFCVINCAYPRGANGFEMALGLDYLEKIFTAFKRGNVQSIINISSQSVYDDQRTEPATEESVICLKTPYSVGKYMTEKMLDAICCEIPHTNIRMASLIGPGFDQRIVNKFIRNALEIKAITILKSNRRFGFLDVKDAASGIWSLLSIDADRWKNIYNLGNNMSYSLENIAAVVVEVFKEKLLPIPSLTVSDGVETGCSAVNYEKLGNDTGYHPNVDMTESIKSILEEMLEEAQKK